MPPALFFPSLALAFQGLVWFQQILRLFYFSESTRHFRYCVVAKLLASWSLYYFQ